MAYDPGINEEQAHRLPGRASIGVILSYVLDWVIIIVVAAAGGVLYKITGSSHAFSLEDPSISFPLIANTVSITVVGIVACGVPAVVILLLCLLIPSSTIEASGQGATGSVWSRRLWEWHAGWLGLGLSLAGAFFITSGLKDVVGKPRPDLIARCDPDLSNVANYIVGGLGLNQTSAPILVNSTICRNPDTSVVKDGFAAFPSGHSSFSWAGLLYLSLWLSAKFAITIQSPLRPSARGASDQNAYQNANTISSRSSAAAAPLYLLLLVLTPVAVALFICATRFADYMHAGWDILGGSMIGMFFAWVGFRWYHAPPRGGDGYFGNGGWAWGPRPSWGAFGVPFGSPGYVGNDNPEQVNMARYRDLELAPMR
ncbi:diacylglycerol pyrophosphate phosphatase [Penicillium lividum]|nr:diacylglycerol pyrophosphate phosphatase [Penicillium lividum]